MYYTTGLTKDLFRTLCDMIRPLSPDPQKPRGRRQKLSLYQKVEVTLTYMKTNRTEDDLAYTFDVDQTTISRIICTYTPIISQVLEHLVPVVDDLDPDEPLIIDGTLSPNWSWKTHPEDYSGKHKTTGMNLQVAVSPLGDLRWVSDPAPGSVHDAEALRASGLLDVENLPNHIGDKGYQGVLPITPVKRNPGQQKLDPRDKAFNKSVNSIRQAVERAIAHLKTWRALHTDYRRPRHTHPETITAILGLHFYKLHFA